MCNMNIVKKYAGRMGGEYFAYVGDDIAGYLKFFGPYDCYGNKMSHGYEIVKIQSYGEYVGTNIENDLARQLSIDMIHICKKI